CGGLVEPRIGQAAAAARCRPAGPAGSGAMADVCPRHPRVGAAGRAVAGTDCHADACPARSRAMTRHRFPIRIYYEDTDFSGNVYHAAYLKFFERGRTEFLRDEGIHHSELAAQGLAFAVRSMDIAFDRAAHI